MALASLSQLLLAERGSGLPELRDNYHCEDGHSHGPSRPTARRSGDSGDAARARARGARGAVSTQDALKAAEHGNSDALAAYLRSGGDSSAASRLHHIGWSLLHLATGCALLGGPAASMTYRTRPEPDVFGGFAGCVALLLAAGADPNIKSAQYSYTPIMGACLSGDAECCRLLLQAGARIDDDESVHAAPPASGTPAVAGGMRARLVAAAQNARSGDGHRQVLAVLDRPPLPLPRAPLDVTAHIVERGDGDERERSVEVRWRIPPAGQGAAAADAEPSIQRYVVRGYARGEEISVQRDAAGPAAKRRVVWGRLGRRETGLCCPLWRPRRRTLDGPKATGSARRRFQETEMDPTGRRRAGDGRSFERVPRTTPRRFRDCTSTVPRDPAP
ncbi:hypothetical protein M885DRAFT_131712 [Pelagophyceae sp. CCMP2097]|nr:hypothetical protein M885DRAFT_131712 [Pelagophyceae sp. CCMP2097]